MRDSSTSHNMLSTLATASRRYACAPAHLAQVNRSEFIKSVRTMATNSETPLLLSPSQVQNLIKMSPNVALLDTTWFMPNSTRNAKAEHAGRRIPDSQFLDLDDVASPHELGLKHMMPTPKIFTDACGTLLKSTSCSYIWL